MPSASPARAANDTAQRLGPPPPPHELGWWTWADEAASLLCWRRRQEWPGHAPRRRHSHGGACRRCRDAIQRLLRGLPEEVYSRVG